MVSNINGDVNPRFARDEFPTTPLLASAKSRRRVLVQDHWHRDYIETTVLLKIIKERDAASSFRFFLQLEAFVFTRASAM